MQINPSPHLILHQMHHHCSHPFHSKNPPNPNSMFFFNSTAGHFISILSSFPAEFFRLLTSSPYLGPAMSSGSARGDYANSVLHFGEREFVVLDFWKMGSGLGLAASVLVVGLIAVLHEAILGLRFFLEREQTLLNTEKAAAMEERRTAKNIGATSRQHYVNEGSTEEMDKYADGKGGGQLRRELGDIFRRTFTRARMFQAFLYFVQWSLFTFAFVLVPCGTFNVPLIFAALVGKTTGYLLFIGSPAMESVERIPSNAAGPDGQIQLTASRKNLRSF